LVDAVNLKPNTSNTKKTALGVDLGVSVATLPVSADLKGKIGNAANVVATVEAFEWHDAKLDVYNCSGSKVRLAGD
jgi:hypothetical protein